MVKHANLLFAALLCGFIGIFSLATTVALGEMKFIVPAVVFLAIAIISTRQFDKLTNND